ITSKRAWTIPLTDRRQFDILQSSPPCLDRMQFGQLKRREFITLFGGAAVAGPRGLLAQPASRKYLVGALMPLPLAALGGFVDMLGQLGFVEDQNLTIDPRGFSVPYDRLAAVAGELV